ncbi:MAG TPA: hypothetical protein DD803_15785 [Alcaligenes faecalis]|nr:hypothetical protein [Alcaligenes faecalis]HBQ90898.1 hypothetical protein [Alcaligenes faecalis]
MSKEETKLGEILDKDKGFIKSRRILITLSIILAVLSLGEIKIKEANTLIFKLEIINTENLKYMLIASVFLCAIRYYSFAHQYHEKIKKMWSKKLMEDDNLFYCSIDEDEFGGLLGVQMNTIPTNHPGMFEISYIKEFPFKRMIRITQEIQPFPGDSRENYIDTENYLLRNSNYSKYNKYLRNLFLIELKFKTETILKHREYLDILSPYWLAIGSVACYFYTYINSSAPFLGYT